MWFTKSTEEVFRAQTVNPATGLSKEEVLVRLERHGRNELKGKPKKSLLSLFLAQLQDMLIYVLLGAAAITLFIGHYVDSVIILCVVYSTHAIGVAQEYKAEKAMEALQKMTTPQGVAAHAAAKSVKSIRPKSCPATSCC
jgi:P-type Ca2+ transporter type 2C